MHGKVHVYLGWGHVCRGANHLFAVGGAILGKGGYLIIFLGGLYNI